MRKRLHALGCSLALFTFLLQLLMAPNALAQEQGKQAPGGESAPAIDRERPKEPTPPPLGDMGSAARAQVSADAATGLKFPWNRAENPWTLTQGPHDWNAGSQSGLDFDKSSTPRQVLSMFEGDVYFVGLDSPVYCRALDRTVQNPTVKVRASDGSGLEIWYLHLSRYSVSQGQHVKQGQEIGYSGSGGCATNVHVHVELVISGVHTSWWGRTIDGWQVSSARQQLYSTNEPPSSNSPAGAPTGLTATALSSSSIRFCWNDVTNETNYSVWRWTGSAWQRIATVGANTTCYTDSGLQPSTRYYYTVCAYNSTGGACASSYASAVTQSSGGGTNSVPRFCEHNRAGGFGRCLDLGPGRYDFTEYGFNDLLTTILIPSGARWRVTIYEHVVPSTNYCYGSGWIFTSGGGFWEINLYEGGLNFNDRTSCAIVELLSSASAADAAVKGAGTPDAVDRTFAPPPRRAVVKQTPAPR